MTSPKDRLMLYLKHKHISLSDFSTQVNLNKAVVSRFGETTAPKSLLKIDENSDVNINWLLTGEGEMLKKSGAITSGSRGDVDGDVEEGYLVPMVPISVMAGNLSDFDTEGIDPSRCEMIVAPVKGIDMALPVCGDSMEPEYPNGSKVFVKKINHFDFIPFGNVFVLDTTNGPLLKKVKRSEHEGHILCVSLNEAAGYEPFDVPLRTVRGMYRVVMCLSIKG